MIPYYLAPLANHVWQSTVFAGVAAILTFVLRKNRAAVRYWLWFATSLKFLVPFSIVVSLGSHIHSRKQPPIAAFHTTVAFQQVIQPFAIHDPGPLLASVPQVSSRIPAVLFVVWACGFLFSLACWMRTWLGFRAAVRRASALKLDLDRSRDSIPAIYTPLLLEPCVFGLLRPVLLLPEGINDRLSPEEFESVVTHELCHVRRRDNLTAALHMFVEAVFWFYPVLSWVRKHLMEEREHACDEEALRSVGNPEVYASGIVNVARLCVESQLECAPGIGSNLKRRIETIMTSPPARQLNIGRKLLLLAAAIVAVVAPIIIGVFNAPASNAQSTTDRPRFEVASIKLNTSGQPGSGFNLGGQIVTIKNTTLENLIQIAYDARNFQVIGGPGWINTDRYDIEAKVEGPFTPGPAGMLQQRLRLQALLEERFNLGLHRDTRDLPIYELTIAKGGLKIQPLKDESCLQPDPTHAGPGPGHQMNEYCGFGGFGRGSFMVTSTTMADLAKSFSMAVGRKVVDKTGITGTFRVNLTYVPDELNGPSPDSENAGPSIFTAIQEQLGMKLESSKGPVDVLIIDHVERPSQN